MHNHSQKIAILSGVSRAALVALVASALGAAPALATPGSGFTPTPISNGHYGALDVKSEKTDKWDLLIKSKDDTDVAVDRLSVAAGGQSGWHHHPAPIFVTVISGEIQWFDGGLCTAKTYHAGDSFIEQAYRVHLVRNTTGATAEFTATRLAPTGVQVRIDSPEPNNCSF